VNAATLSLAQRAIAGNPPRHQRSFRHHRTAALSNIAVSIATLNPTRWEARMDEASWRNPMVEAPDAAAETRAIRAADEAARRIARLLAAGYTPAELGYPELVPKEIVRREWRAWYNAYKSKAH
jgi:hypothetical protein